MFALCTLNMTDLVQREHPEIMTGIGVEYGIKWLSSYKSSNISEARKYRIVPSLTVFKSRLDTDQFNTAYRSNW